MSLAGEAVGSSEVPGLLRPQQMGQRVPEGPSRRRQCPKASVGQNRSPFTGQTGRILWVIHLSLHFQQVNYLKLTLHLEGIPSLVIMIGAEKCT